MPPSSASTPMPMDPDKRKAWYGMSPMTDVISSQTQLRKIQWITLWFSCPCCQPISELTDLFYRNIVCSKISDIILTSIQLLLHVVPLGYSESLLSQEYLYFSPYQN